MGRRCKRSRSRLVCSHQTDQRSRRGRSVWNRPGRVINHSTYHSNHSFQVATMCYCVYQKHIHEEANTQWTLTHLYTDTHTLPQFPKMADGPPVEPTSLSSRSFFVSSSQFSVLPSALGGPNTWYPFRFQQRVKAADWKPALMWKSLQIRAPERRIVHMCLLWWRGLLWWNKLGQAETSEPSLRKIRPEASSPLVNN